MKKTELMVFGGYCRDGCCTAHVARIAEDTRAGAVPFLWAADFNADMDEVMADPGMQLLDAIALEPDGGEVSCHQGRGALIDFVIVSRAVAPYVRATFVNDAPWAPHSGISIKVRRDPRAVMQNILTKPAKRRPRLPKVRDGAAHDGIPWQEALRAAEDRAEKEPGMECQKKVASLLGIEDVSRQLGKEYGRWAAALELQELSRRGIDAATKEGQAYLGRARTPKIREVALWPKEASASVDAAHDALVDPQNHACAHRVRRRPPRPAGGP